MGKGLFVASYQKWLKGGVKDHSFRYFVWWTTDKHIHPSFWKTSDCVFNKTPHSLISQHAPLYFKTTSLSVYNSLLSWWSFNSLPSQQKEQVTSYDHQERTSVAAWSAAQCKRLQDAALRCSPLLMEGWASFGRMLLALCASVSLAAIRRIPLTSNVKCFGNAVSQDRLRLCTNWDLVFPLLLLRVSSSILVSFSSELLLTPFWRHEVYLHAPLIIRLKILLTLMQLLQNILRLKPVPKSFGGTQ